MLIFQRYEDKLVHHAILQNLPQEKRMYVKETKPLMFRSNHSERLPAGVKILNKHRAS